VVGLQIKDVEFRLKSSYNQFVHIDVRSIEFEATDTILKVGIPSKAVCFEIKQLHITIVITSCNASLFLVKAVTKAYCPAIRLNEF
jgi:hypothetical protein